MEDAENMDFLKDINVGNLLTLITTLSVILLGWSDIKKRRAEAKKTSADARVSDTTADTQMMTQIKQASIDLMIQLKTDNEILRQESQEQNHKYEELYAKYEVLLVKHQQVLERLEKCEKCLKSLDRDCNEGTVE